MNKYTCATKFTKKHKRGDCVPLKTAYKDLQVDLAKNHKVKMCVRGYTRNHSGNLVAKHQPIKFIFQVCGNEEIKWKPIPSFGIPYPLALETSPKWNYIETFGKAKPNKWFALPLTTTLENGLLIPNKYPPGTVDLTPNTCEPGTPNPGSTPP